MIRFSDIFLSIIGILLFSPVMLITFILILFDTGSPFFLQKRVGLNKKLFTLIKFRTMKLNTISVGTHLIDRRKITPLGKILRKTKIDELPQLWNVISGDMSLVGPRPCLQNQKKLIYDRNKLGVYKVVPGITGLAQLKDINMSNPSLLAKTDFKMIKKMNLFIYLYFIFLTILKIFGFNLLKN